MKLPIYSNNNIEIISPLNFARFTRIVNKSFGRKKLSNHCQKGDSGATSTKKRFTLDKENYLFIDLYQAWLT